MWRGGNQIVSLFYELWCDGLTRATTVTLLLFAFFSKLANPDVVDGVVAVTSVE